MVGHKTDRSGRDVGLGEKESSRKGSGGKEIRSEVEKNIHEEREQMKER